MARKRDNAEDRFDFVLMDYVRQQYPTMEERFTHIGNGEARPKVLNKKTGKWVCPAGEKLKRKGMKPGVWDYYYGQPSGVWPSLWLENKIPPNGLTEAQKTWGANMRHCGHMTIVLFGAKDSTDRRGMDEAKMVIDKWVAGLAVDLLWLRDTPTWGERKKARETSWAREQLREHAERRATGFVANYRS